MADKITQFLKVAGVEGESIAPGHEGWIDVLSFQGEPSQVLVGPGVGTGKPDLKGLSVTLVFASHWHALFDARTSGRHLSSAMLDVKVDDKFMRFTLNDVLITEYLASSAPAEAMTERVTLEAIKGITSSLIDPPPAKEIDPKSPAGAALAKVQKQAVLHIRVLDENGKERVPKGDDRVFAIERLKYDKEDGFAQLLEGAGEFVVTVEYQGFARVQQWFRYEAPSARPTVAPFWPGTEDDPSVKGKRRVGYLLACMQLNRSAGGHDESRSPKVFNLTVALHPTRTCVAVIGCDYWEEIGTPKETHRNLDFEDYAITYLKHLTAAGALNLSSAMDMLNCQRGRLERWHQVRTADTGGVAWRRQQILNQKEPCPRWPTGKAFDAWRNALAKKPDDARKYLGANDVYYHMDTIGRNAPRSVADFSIWSHSWDGGPILFDTYDANTDKPARDASDLDMRSTKDFRPGNTGFWNNMPMAFAADGVVRVWGCFATTLFNNAVRFLLGEGGVKGRFIYKDEGFNLDLDRNGVVNLLKKTITADSYMSRIANFVSRNAFGGLPGFGSDNAKYSDIPTLPAGLRGKISGQICHVPRITMETRFRKLFESAELGSQRFNEFGYMLYKP